MKLFFKFERVLLVTRGARAPSKPLILHPCINPSGLTHSHLDLVTFQMKECGTHKRRRYPTKECREHDRNAGPISSHEVNVVLSVNVIGWHNT